MVRTPENLAVGAGPSPLSHFGTVAVWLAVQMLTLLLPIFQIRLADQYPRPAESLALAQMLCVDVAMSAMLMPILFRTPGSTLITVACAWPFLQLAATFSAAPHARAFAAGLYLTGWLLVLGGWSWLLRSDVRRIIASAVASALALGGPLLWYLKSEFATELPMAAWMTQGLAGPIMGALAVLQRQNAAQTWLLMEISLVATALICGVTWVLRARGKSA